MSLRNFVPSYPQLSVNGPPPPHHQAHRVQALPVNVATALQQQISQQQAAAAQQQSQGSAPPNQNSGGNVQSAPSHEYHITSCLPFQAPAAQNFIRLSNGGYAQAHPQNQPIYQTQGGPPGVVQNQQQSQQSNQAQSLSNQQNQARLTPMTQPTAPPTPPNQQQQQSQQPQQYAVIQQGAGGAGNPRASQYRPQSQVTRRQHPQQMNPQYAVYQQPLGSVPYGNLGNVQFVLPAGPHVRTPYGYMLPQMFNTNYAAPSYQPMAAPTNGPQRQSTPQAAVPAMPPSQPSEYSGYQNMEVYQSSMQAPSVPAQAPPQPPQQKTAKKAGSKAIQIINPNTGKSIFEDDTGASGAAIATVDKAITASHNELNKDEAVDKDTLPAEPSTPIVSAISDGPSVEITPKHQVNKIKKMKPPEPVPAPTPQLTQAPVLAEPPMKVVKDPEPEPAVQIPRDKENNVSAAVPIIPPPVAAVPQVSVPVPVEPVAKAEAILVVPLDSNDTNNNNYQKVEEKEPKKEVKETQPQDTNNNSTDDKSIMTSTSIRHTPAEPDEKPVEKEKPERKISTMEGPIDYDDGQWSPANLAGKKYYTRDQLLKLKDQQRIATLDPPFARLPETVAHTLMKNNNDTLTNTLTQTMPLQMTGGMQRGAPFDTIAPKFMTNPMNPNRNNPYQKRPSQQGNKQQMPNSGRGSQPGIIKMTLSLMDDVKLNEAENAWKPSHLVKKADMTEEEHVTYELLSKFRSMLNKLTAENFDLLVEQVKTYKIDTSERLDGVISLVFEKAISEPKFAPTYANLCHRVATITTAPQGEGADGKKKTLKAKLITQCQKEFERHKEESIVFNDIEDKLREIENQPEQERREDEKARLEEEHYRVRQRANGTVKFIGELFKIDMLTSKIMRACIDMLLQEVTEEKIERVCKLLTTIGDKLERQDGHKSLDRYFHQLLEMLHPNHKIIKSSRIKFEIQNLEDLRNSGWKARRADLTPRTMDQIQSEADHEQQMINYQTRQNAKDDRNRGGNQGYNNRRNQQDSDGWSVQQNNKSRMPPIQFKNITIPMPNTEGPKLGNPTDFQKFMVNNNKFSGLPVDTDSDGPPRFGQGGGSKNSSMERGGDRNSRFYGNGTDGRYSGRNSGSNQNSRNSSQIRSRDDSGGPGGPSRSLQAPRHQQAPPPNNMSFSGALKQPQKPPTPTPSVPMTREEVDKSYEAMLEVVNKYHNDKLSLEGAVEALKPLSINSQVLVEIYNKVLDRKDLDRENLMTLICELMKKRKLSRDDNRAALIATLEMAPETVCDVPLVYEYIAQFLAELVIANVLTFQEVLQICEAEIDNKKGEDMLKFMFTAVEKRHGAGTLKQIVAGANCDLGKFVNDGNYSRWLEASKFAVMVRHGTNGNEDVLARIKQLLDQKKSHDVIMEFINSSNCTIDPPFIRDLTSAVIGNCCEEYPQTGYKLLNNRLGTLAPILQRFIDNQRPLELQCISEIQSFAFAREYPPGLLNSIFDILYDNDVLSLEAFEMWKDSEDPVENQKGKGVAICSTRQFFTRLAEDKDDDGDFGEEGEMS